MSGTSIEPINDAIMFGNKSVILLSADFSVKTVQTLINGDFRHKILQYLWNELFIKFISQLYTYIYIIYSSFIIDHF